MFRNMWYFAQFYANSYRICKHWKVFVVARRAIESLNNLKNYIFVSFNGTGVIIPTKPPIGIQDIPLIPMDLSVALLLAFLLGSGYVIIRRLQHNTYIALRFQVVTMANGDTYSCLFDDKRRYDITLLSILYYFSDVKLVNIRIRTTNDRNIVALRFNNSKNKFKFDLWSRGAVINHIPSLFNVTPVSNLPTGRFDIDYPVCILWAEVPNFFIWKYMTEVLNIRVVNMGEVLEPDMYYQYTGILPIKGTRYNRCNDRIISDRLL
uniref:Uncharacterized protein n=1 Tax=Rhynchobrunnera orthospora TaxID=210010 RepID=V5W5Q3_9HELO|nr:hypothetical protein [Rhynchobrunnera orthospora]AHC02399.1 hypothetical protein [Rhynchobrunnera orthospora]